MSKSFIVSDGIDSQGDISGEGWLEISGPVLAKSGISTTPNTYVSGDGLAIRSSGPSQINESQVTGRRYQLAYQEVDKTGSQKLFTTDADSEVTEPRQSVYDTQCTSPSEFDGVSPKNEIINAFYAKTDGTVNNFRFQITAEPSGNPVISYPDKFKFADGEGVTLSGAGTHKIDIYYVNSSSPARFLSGQNVTFKAYWEDAGGTVLGDSSNQIWYEVDIQEFAFTEREAFTPEEKIKLDGLAGSTYLGVFADLTTLQTDHPTANNGDTATVTDPSANLFYWDGDSWEDTGTGYLGDMLKSVYDPTSINANAFSMTNMTEGPTSKIMTLSERSKLGDIDVGAEVNVQSDWDQSDTGEDDYIKNKPSDVTDLSGHAATELSDITSSGSGSIITSTERTNLSNQSGTNTGDITLSGVADDTTDDTLDLTDQELTVNQVTQSTDGAMIANDKLKLDNMSDNCAGDGWVSGLEVTEHDPKNQTVDYTAGTYLIDGELKTIAAGSVYDLENGYGALDHYTDLTSYQHRFVILYVDDDLAIKSIGGLAAEKKEVPPLPITPVDSVAIALIEAKVDNSANPKDIKNKEITDTRNAPAYNTDEFVRVSADDLSVGHLSDKLSNNGNVTFTIENPGGEETIKADAALSVYYAESLGESSNGDTTYETKVSLTDTFTAGDYFIEVGYIWRSNADDRNFMAEVVLDSTRLGQEHVQEIKEKGPSNRIPAFRRFKQTLTAASHTIYLNYKISDDLDEAYIWDASITVTKIDILS